MHHLERVVDLGELLPVCDKLIHFEPALEVVRHQARQLAPALDASEGAAAPDAPRHKLEGWEVRVVSVSPSVSRHVDGLVQGRREEDALTSCLDLLARRRDADDDTLAPTLVARLQRGPHHAYVPRTVKGVVAPAVRHLDQLVLDARPLGKLRRVDKVRRAKLSGPRLLTRVQIHDDDLSSLVRHSALGDAQAHTAGPENSDVGALLHVGGDPRRTVSGRDATSQEAGLLHGRVLLDSDHGDVCHDGVLVERRRAHEVQEVLALALESGCPVWHLPFALGGPDLPAQVCLAGFAKLTFLALGCANGERQR